MTPPPAALPAPPRRLCRAGVAAGCSTLLGASAHQGGGGAIEPATLLAGLAGALAVTWWLARRERGFLSIAGLQLGAQQVVHLALSVGAGHGHGGPLPDDLMFLGHIAAGLGSALVLAAAERRVWAGARALTARLLRWWRVFTGLCAPSGPRPVRVRFGTPAPAWRPTPLRHVLVRRGPPPPVRRLGPGLRPVG